MAVGNVYIGGYAQITAPIEGLSTINAGGTITADAASGDLYSGKAGGDENFRIENDGKIYTAGGIESDGPINAPGYGTAINQAMIP